MSEIFDLDPIADNNTARWPENMLAATVNNSAREDEAMLARDIRDRTQYASSSGTSSAYTLTPSRTVSALSNSIRQVFRAHTTCAASPTFNLSGLGAYPIRKNFNSALAAGDISSGQVVEVAWDAANSIWQLLSPTTQTTSNQTFGLKVGDVKLSMASSPDSGFIRLKETTQSISSTAYPDLYAWLSAQGFPWGSGAGTANLPPAGGYFLRFGASNTTVDPAGARIAGSTASDTLKQTTIPSTGLSASSSSSASVSGGVIGGTGSSSVPATGGTTFPIGASSINVSVSTSTSISGSVTLPGATETAPKSVTMYADILAVPALVASGLIGVGGLAYKWSTNTATSDPGSGYLKVNNATFTSATALYVSETGSNGAPFASILQSFPTGTRFYIVKVGSPATFVYASLSSTATDNGAWDTFSITPIGTSVAALADGDDVAIVVSVAGTSGSNGATGASGPVPLDYTWDTGTSAADPGVGKVRANNASLSSATALYINETDRLANNLAATLATFGASTNTTKGLLQIVDLTTPANRAYFTVSSFTDNGSYDTIGVAYLSGATSFSALNVALMFSPAGNKGADGAGSFTSLTPGAGTTSDTTANAPGSAITSAGTISAAELVNAQTGTTYTVVDGDRAKLVTFSNAASIAVTLPQAGATTTFKTGWFVDVVNIGAGTATITPTTSTINGAATLVLLTGQGCRIVSDGTNYQISAKPASFDSLSIHGSDVASAGTINLDSATGNLVDVTGTTTITAITLADGRERTVRFTGILTLTNGASLVLPGGANITTAAGDYAIFRGYAAGVVRCAVYQKASGTAVVSSGGGSGSPSIPQGRITLTTVTPVLTGNVSGATTVYYTPYTGQYVPIYSGSAWVMTDVGGELSQATTDTIKSPAACTTNSNYDLFVWNDGGTYRCTRGPAWSSDTSRGTGAGTTELQAISGIYTNKNAIGSGTNGPAANRGTYVGTIRTNGTSTVDFNLGASAVGGTAGFIGLWNQYNRVGWAANPQDSTASWSYGTASWRAVDASNAMRVSFVCGQNEGIVDAIYNGVCNVSSAAGGYGLGYDSTTALATGSTPGAALVAGTSSAVAVYAGLPGLGFHYIQALEYGGTSITMYGIQSAGRTYSGLQVKGMF